MNSALSFRLATEADIPELVDLVNRAYRGDATSQGWTHESHLLEGPRTNAAAVQELLQTPGGTIITCRRFDDDALLGCVYVQQQGGQLYLGMLAVDPDQQAGGIGKALLRAAEDHARQRQCRVVSMTVLSARTELLAWYQRHGYQPTGETQPFPTGPNHGRPRQPLTLLVLTKDVGESAS